MTVQLPRGGTVTAEIAPIAGTEYTFVLAVPLGQYAPGTDPTTYAPNSAVYGDLLSFTINGTPAFFKDGNDFTVETWEVQPGSMGKALVLHLAITRPDQFPLGDVNANGRRDSADALLTLKYDVGLIAGGEQFPPIPNTIYVPLCDMQADGKCNSSDALRILQSDVGLPGFSCPASSLRIAAVQTLQPTANAALLFGLEVTEGVPSNAGMYTIAVQVLAQDTAGELGATTLELHYPSQLWQPSGCTPDPNLTLGVCNPDFAPGVIRFNAARSLASAENVSNAQEIALAVVG